jgi:hypothetical protein
MATQRITLAESSEGPSSLVFLYDDAHAGTVADPFLGTGIEVSVGPGTTKPCAVTVVMNDGTNLSQVVQPNQQNRILNIPQAQRPKGVFFTNWKGQQVIQWPFSSVGIAF